MKKTLLASIFAGLFTFGVSAGEDHHVLKVKLNADANSPAVVSIEDNGNKQVFEFSQEELKDMDAVAASLSNVDEKTRTTVLNALNGVHMGHKQMMFLSDDGKSEHQQFMVIKHKDTSGSDEEHEVVMELEGNELHHRIIEIDGVDGEQGEHKVMKFVIGDGAHGLHRDTSHAAKMIENLLSHSDMSAEQLDTIQALIDAKR